jgi:predicted ATPase
MQDDEAIDYVDERSNATAVAASITSGAIMNTAAKGRTYIKQQQHQQFSHRSLTKSKRYMSSVTANFKTMKMEPTLASDYTEVCKLAAALRVYQMLTLSSITLMVSCS